MLKPNKDLFVQRLVFLAFICSILITGCETKEDIQLYVSIDGNDQNNGSINSPFASLSVAIDKVRVLRKSDNTSPAVIYLRAGRHQINQTLVLDMQDGRPSSSSSFDFEKYGAGERKDSAYLTIAAYPDERPVISSGIPVKGWKKLTHIPLGLPERSINKVWVADIPDGLDGFNTLYDENGRLNRARGSGFSPTKSGTKRNLYFPEGALKHWDNISDVEIQVRPRRFWVVNMLPLEFVDEVKGMAKTRVNATYDMSPLPKSVHSKRTSVWVENTIEVLDEPGEWVVNTKTRKIYLWPLETENNEPPQGVLAPSTSELVRVEGDIDYGGVTDKPVIGITFKGITFTHADRRAWKNNKDRLGWGLQHDWDLFDRPTAMLRFRGAENCEVIDCNFLNSGGSGIRLDLYAQRNKIENCEFAHLGEAGIILAGYGPGTKDVNHHNDIFNNHIHHFSEITWHSPGIWAWQSGHNHMAHNYIHHSGYSSVLITNRVEPNRVLDGEGGRTIRQSEIPEKVKEQTKETYENWKVREKYIHARHNLFEYNEITHSVQKLTDGNGIYVSGAGTGNIIRYNYLHDNLAKTLPSPIRCDDDQHETLIYGNVLFNNVGYLSAIASKGINDIVNNFILAPAVRPASGYISFQWVRVTNSKVRHNIIVSHANGGKAHGERPYPRTEDGNPLLIETDMDSNLYYHATNPNWVDEHLKKMRAVGKEQYSLFGDPLFVDPINGDFGFQENSPALKLGIEPLDVSKMGILKHLH